MKVFTTMLSKAKFALMAGMMTAVAVLGFSVSTVQASPSNDIMPGGASSPSVFIKKLKANNPSDMDNIYANSRYNLPKSQYDEFQKYAKSGQINPKNGNITVGGKTVGYDGLSLGRNPKSSSTKVSINGKTYYQSHIKDLTKYFNDAMVLFDAKGNVQTVIMNLCGNPIKITPNNPEYECKMLNVTPGSDSMTFNFSSSVSASNGATVTKVVYDFGDGKTETQKSPSTVVTHKYATAGTYTAKVTAYVKTTFGRGEFPITVTSNCTKTVTPKETPKPSVTITKTVDGVDRKEVALNTPFTYQLVVKNTGNVDLKDALVSDSAPANVTFVSTDNGVITHNTLSYTTNLAVGASETINITAKLTAYVAGDIVNKACVDTPTIPGSPDACDTTVITTPKPGVDIEKLVNGKKSVQVAVNEPYTYTIKVTNTGESDLVNALVTDPAPQNVQFLTTDKKGTITGNSLTYTIPSLKVGESTVITLTAKVTAQVEGSIKNTACVDAVEVNPSNPGVKDDCDDAYVNVPPVVPTNPNISIVKTVNNVKQTEVKVGEVFTYKIVVKNNGDTELKNVAVSDPAPAGVTMLGADIGSITGNKWTYTIASLKAGESQTFTITAKVAVYQAGAMVNTACVNAPEVNPTTPDKDDACDTATVTVPTPETPITPPELPNTGAGNVIGLFFGTVVAAGLFHHFVLGRKKATQE